MTSEASSYMSSGELERPEDAGRGEAGEVRRWNMEIDLAGKTEKRWRDNANKAIDRYRDEKDRKSWQFNILWSNVEVQRPNLYSRTPKADVRRRFRDEDPAGKVAAQVMERALDYCMDSYDFDHEMNEIILDYLLPCRAVARVRFEPVIEQKNDTSGQPYEALTYAKTTIERVPWDRFRRGPGISWKEVTWVAYEHHLTLSEVEEKFGKDAASQVQWDIVMSGVSEDKAAEEPSVFKRVRVWEIWDRAKRQILFMAPSRKDGFLKREEDKLNLEGFFDCERPLYAIESGTTLVPQVEYEMYRDQARELDRVTMRINKLVETLKLRGIYDATVTELKDVMQASDGDMLPVTSPAAMQLGGMDKAVWMMPIAEAASVLKELLLHREQLKQTIYEITGISDILRGSSDPNETLGAQQLKAQTGSLRLQRRQRDVQRFVRGLLRKKAEVIAENYTPQILSLMTGISLPSAQDKLMAQQAKQQYDAAVAQAQASGMEPPPEPPGLAKTLATPSWDEVMGILKNDMLRSFRIDVETDSTISADQASEREQVTELITGIGGFVQSIGPAVQSGTLSSEAAKKLLISSLRRFNLGRDVEDAMEEEMSKPPPPPQPDPRVMEMQMKQQASQDDLALKKEQMAAELEMKRQHMADERALKAEAKRLEIEDGGKMRQEQRDHEIAVSKMLKPEDYEAEMKEVVEAIKGLAVAVVQSTQNATAAVEQKMMQDVSAIVEAQRQDSQAVQYALGQSAQSGAATAAALERLASVLGAEREAVLDPKTGRIRGSRVKLTQPTS